MEYKGRSVIYTLLIAFFLLPYFVNKYNLSDQKLAKTQVGDVVIYHYPMFIFGVIFADLEMQTEKPLDSLRNLSLAGTIIKNTILIIIVISFGSYKDEDCLYKDSGPCTYWTVVSFNKAITRDIALYIGAISLILLALTSTVT